MLYIYLFYGIYSIDLKQKIIDARNNINGVNLQNIGRDIIRRAQLWIGEERKQFRNSLTAFSELGF